MVDECLKYGPTTSNDNLEYYEFTLQASDCTLSETWSTSDILLEEN